MTVMHSVPGTAYDDVFVSFRSRKRRHTRKIIEEITPPRETDVREDRARQRGEGPARAEGVHGCDVGGEAGGGWGVDSYACGGAVDYGEVGEGLRKGEKGEDEVKRNVRGER